MDCLLDRVREELVDRARVATGASGSSSRPALAFCGTCGSDTNVGGRQVPLETPAATPAMLRALARSRPCPKPDTAISASLVGDG